MTLNKEKISFVDNCTWEEACNSEVNLLRPIFKDSEMLIEENLQTIRNRLHKGEF
jgi:hypothetical protein